MNVTLRTYIDVKPVVTLVASMEEGYDCIECCIWGRATKQRGCLFEGIQ